MGKHSSFGQPSREPMMRGRRKRPRSKGFIALLALMVGLAACGGRSLVLSVDGGTDATASHCRWPTEFDSTDAAGGQCRAAMAYLSCKSSGVVWGA